MIEWYTAIRAAKLNRLAIAYPSAQVDEVNKTTYFCVFGLCRLAAVSDVVVVVLVFSNFYEKAHSSTSKPI